MSEGTLVDNVDKQLPSVENTVEKVDKEEVVDSEESSEQREVSEQSLGMNDVASVDGEAEGDPLGGSAEPEGTHDLSIEDIKQGIP